MGTVAITDPGSNLIENGYNKYTDWLIVNPKSQLEELDPGSGVVTAGIKRL